MFRLLKQTEPESVLSSRPTLDSAKTRFMQEF